MSAYPVFHRGEKLGPGDLTLRCRSEHEDARLAIRFTIQRQGHRTSNEVFQDVAKHVSYDRSQNMFYAVFEIPDYANYGKYYIFWQLGQDTGSSCGHIFSVLNHFYIRQQQEGGLSGSDVVDFLS